MQSVLLCALRLQSFVMLCTRWIKFLFEQFVLLTFFMDALFFAVCLLCPGSDALLYFETLLSWSCAMEDPSERHVAGNDVKKRAHCTITRNIVVSSENRLNNALSCNNNNQIRENQCTMKRSTRSGDVFSNHMQLEITNSTKKTI